MNENLFQVILTVIPVLGAIITYFVVPYFQANVESIKLTQYKEWATLAVKTAEMLWKESGHGKDKKEYVTDFLNKCISLDKKQKNELDDLICINRCAAQKQGFEIGFKYAMSLIKECGLK